MLNPVGLKDNTDVWVLVSAPLEFIDYRFRNDSGAIRYDRPERVQTLRTGEVAERACVEDEDRHSGRSRN